MDFFKSSKRLSLVLATSIILSLFTGALSQERGKDKTKDRTDKKIVLKEGERLNGFTISEIESKSKKKEYLVKFVGIQNPNNGKRLDGKYDFYYKCKLFAAVVVVSIILAKGEAERRFRCRFGEDPWIYY